MRHVVEFIENYHFCNEYLEHPVLFSCPQPQNMSIDAFAASQSFSSAGDTVLIIITVMKLIAGKGISTDEKFQ